jgi:hypothetical protein
MYFGGLECVVHSFAYVVHFFRDVWIRTQIATVASRRAINLATHLYKFTRTLIFFHQFHSP